MPAFGVVEPYKLVQSCDTPIMLLGCTCNSVQGTGLPPTWPEGKWNRAWENVYCIKGKMTWKSITRNQ